MSCTFVGKVVVGQICEKDVHIRQKVEFCIQRYFHMLNSKIVGSKRSDQWIGHHLEFQYDRHDETLNITILGSK